MTHVVTENCINCKYTNCVTVCPTDAFREGMNMLVIEPPGDPTSTCIDCAACVPECPTTAIYADADVPSQWHGFIEQGQVEILDINQLELCLRAFFGEFVNPLGHRLANAPGSRTSDDDCDF